VDQGRYLEARVGPMDPWALLVERRPVAGASETTGRRPREPSHGSAKNPD